MDPNLIFARSSDGVQSLVTHMPRTGRVSGRYGRKAGCDVQPSVARREIFDPGAQRKGPVDAGVSTFCVRSLRHGE